MILRRQYRSCIRGPTGKKHATTWSTIPLNLTRSCKCTYNKPTPEVAHCCILHNAIVQDQPTRLCQAIYRVVQQSRWSNIMDTYTPALIISITFNIDACWRIWRLHLWLHCRPTCLSGQSMCWCVPLLVVVFLEMGRATRLAFMHDAVYDASIFVLLAY